MYNNTTLPKTFEAVKEYLSNLSDDETVNAHNTYCREQNYSDDEIYNNDEDFFNTFFDGKVLEAVRAVSYGEYQYNHDYVKFNGYANLESFNSPTEHVDLDTIANDILENPENYGIELEDVFCYEGINYEGEEEDLKEQYEEYKTETEEENEGEEIKTVLLTFGEWLKENVSTID